MVKSFFGEGHFWTTLKDTVDAIKNAIKKHNIRIKKLEQERNLLANQLKKSIGMNLELEKRVRELESQYSFLLGKQIGKNYQNTDSALSIEAQSANDNN